MLLAERYSTPFEIQRRAFERVAFDEPCFAQTGTHGDWVQAEKISEGGISLVVEETSPWKEGAEVALFIRNFPTIYAIVRWCEDGIAGLEFCSPIGEHPLLLNLIRILREGTADLKLVDEQHEREPEPEVTVHPKAAIVSEQLEADTQKRRAHTRMDYNATCGFKTSSRQYHAEAANLSRGGIRMTLKGLGSVSIGMEGQLTIGNFEPISAVVRWLRDRQVGLEFTTPLSSHPELNALMNDLQQ